ncbi:MAG TPA: PTS sugar transporter subunit IIA [Tepidisphaeraceae bacterium]|jgi:mannitol/fructose-specific phosphotransferase system IIA component (Ntr-type)
MKLSEFIVPEAIVPNLQSAERDGAVRELVASLADAGALPRAAIDEVLAAVIKREQNGSTGFGKGVAVPHVKHPKVKKMAGTIGRSEGGIDFAALDHQPVYSVVLLLSPDNQPQQHLQAMNVIFNNLQKDMFRRFLRQSTTRQAIQELLDEADQGK